MSRKAIRWINGIGFKAPGEKQRSFIGGRLAIPTNEDNIDQICDNLKKMAAMCRDIGEDWMNIDIKKNEGEQKMMKQYSFERSVYHPDGKNVLIDKVREWEQAGSDEPEPEQADPFEDDEEQDLPF